MSCRWPTSRAPPAARWARSTCASSTRTSTFLPSPRCDASRAAHCWRAGTVARELEFVLEHPDFWRAALRKGATDPTFWQEFRELGRESVLRFIDCHERL